MVERPAATGCGSVAAMGVWPTRRMCSSDSVISVVATDRTTVAATIATTAHSGKCAGAALVGGGGGMGATKGSGGGRAADAAGARPVAAVTKIASPLSAVIIRRDRGLPRLAERGCEGAGRWLIWVAPLVRRWTFPVGLFRCPHPQGSARRPELPWDRLGRWLGAAVDLVVEWAKAACLGDCGVTPGGGL
jgi:hypothetical protein